MPPALLGIDKNERMRCLLNKLNGVDERIGVIPHNKTRRDESDEESGQSHPRTHLYDFKDRAKNRHTHPRPKKEPVPDAVIHHENNKMKEIRRQLYERGCKLMREDIVKNLVSSVTEEKLVNNWDVPMRNACIDVQQMLHDFFGNTEPLPVPRIRRIIDGIQHVVEELRGHIRDSKNKGFSDFVKRKIQSYIHLLEQFSLDFLHLLTGYQHEYDEILSQYYRPYTKHNWHVYLPVSRYPENVQPRMQELIGLVMTDVRKRLNDDLKDIGTFPLHDQDPENPTLVFEYRERVQETLKGIISGYVNTRIFSARNIKKQLADMSTLCELKFYKEYTHHHNYRDSLHAWAQYKEAVKELYRKCESFLTEYVDIAEGSNTHKYRER
jgi:hypothetical protein